MNDLAFVLIALIVMPVLWIAVSRGNRWLASVQVRERDVAVTLAGGRFAVWRVPFAEIASVEVRTGLRTFSRPKGTRWLISAGGSRVAIVTRRRDAPLTTPANLDRFLATLRSRCPGITVRNV